MQVLGFESFGKAQMRRCCYVSVSRNVSCRLVGNGEEEIRRGNQPPPVTKDSAYRFHPLKVSAEAFSNVPVDVRLF